MLSRRKNLFLAILLSCLVGCSNEYNSGDRVLVDRFAYDAGVGEPRRFEVVVFKYPKAPVDKGTPKNYIKRLMGLPGELLAIFFGQLFTYRPGPGEPPIFNDSDVDPANLWRTQYTHTDDSRSIHLFETPGKFTIVRKPPAVMLAMRRIVNDNDFQDPEMAKRWDPAFSAREHPGARAVGWIPDDTKGFFHKGADNGRVDWLRYQHLTRLAANNGRATKPALITDMMDYNFGISRDGRNHPGENWVGDLMLECELNVDKAEGEFRMELSRSINRFQARFDLATGQCSLYKIFKDGKDEKEEQLGKGVATRVKSTGRYSLRLANFDARLTVWVDDDLPFGDGQEYPPPGIASAKEGRLDEAVLRERRGPTKENDLEKPASIGSKGAEVRVHHLRVWRDTYYTIDPQHAAADFSLSNDEADAWRQKDGWRDPEQWAPLRKLPSKVMYVQPGHFLCLGDNSPMSSDSRDWGLVPQRLMLGRALMVYFPLGRAGPIR